MFKSAKRTYSYLGVEAVLVQHRLTKGAQTRVDVLVWQGKAVGQDVEFEAGTAVVTLYTGRGPKTRKVGRLVLDPGATEAQVQAAVERLFAAHNA